jgi:microcystin-dependent protein
MTARSRLSGVKNLLIEVYDAVALTAPKGDGHLVYVRDRKAVHAWDAAEVAWRIPNGLITGTRANRLAYGIPMLGMKWFETDTYSEYLYDGATWQRLSPAAGTIQMFGGINIPYGWLECNGVSMLRTDYPELYAQISSNYGAVDGTHFTLPDLSNKFARGAAGTPSVGGGSDTHFHTDGTLAATAHSHTIAHAHAMADHKHGLSTANNSPTNGASSRVNAASTDFMTTNPNTGGSTAASSGGPSTTDVTGQTDPASNVPAYTEVKYIIKI